MSVTTIRFAAGQTQHVCVITTRPLLWPTKLTSTCVRRVNEGQMQQMNETATPQVRPHLRSDFLQRFARPDTCFDWRSLFARRWCLGLNGELDSQKQPRARGRSLAIRHDGIAEHTVCDAMRGMVGLLGANCSLDIVSTLYH